MTSKLIVLNADYNVHFLTFTSLYFQQLYAIHNEFLAALKKATGTTPCKASHKPTIPDCFMQWKEKFLIYGDFCSNLPRAQERVDELVARSEALREKINVSTAQVTRVWCNPYIPTQPWGRLKWPSTIPWLAAHFTRGLMPDVEICKHRKEYGHAWHWISFLRRKMQLYTLGDLTPL